MALDSSNAALRVGIIRLVGRQGQLLNKIGIGLVALDGAHAAQDVTHGPKVSPRLCIACRALARAAYRVDHLGIFPRRASPERPVVDGQRFLLYLSRLSETAITAADFPRGRGIGQSRAAVRAYCSPTLVLLALDWADGNRDDLLGIAIERTPGPACGPR